MNFRDETGRTALHLAAAHGNVTTVELLLNNARFVEADAQDKSGRTALHWAAANGHRDAVAAFLQHDRFNAAGG